MSARLTFAVPSKGRLMEQTAEFLGQSGLALRKAGHDRGYRGAIEGVDGIDVAFISASEIVAALGSGRAAHRRHRRGPGAREHLQRRDARDVPEAAGLRSRRRRRRRAALLARRQRGGRSRRRSPRSSGASMGAGSRRDKVSQSRPAASVAAKGVTDYRIVESLGATEGTPAAGTADLIVDITTTGATLAANGLRCSTTASFCALRPTSSPRTRPPGAPKRSRPSARS